jgi:hypothetical protein
MFAARLEREYGEYLISGSSAWSNPDKILNMAGNLYTKLVTNVSYLQESESSVSLRVQSQVSQLWW